jgi:hypothetical protein
MPASHNSGSENTATRRRARELNLSLRAKLSSALLCCTLCHNVTVHNLLFIIMNDKEKVLIHHALLLNTFLVKM